MSPVGLPRIISMHCCSARASPSDLKRDPIVHAGQWLFSLQPREQKEDVVSIAGKIEIALLSAKVQAVDFQKRNHGTSLKREKTRRIKEVQNFSEQ